MQEKSLNLFMSGDTVLSAFHFQGYIFYMLLDTHLLKEPLWRCSFKLHTHTLNVDDG